MAEREYIERDKVLKLIDEHRKVLLERGEDGITEKVLGAIAAVISDKGCFPAADIAPVVRCKDCKHAYINSFSKISGVVLCKILADRTEGVAYTMLQDDFCSYGKRKENENG